MPAKEYGERFLQFMRDAVEPKPKSCWFILYCTSSIPISLRLYYMLYLFWSYHPFFLHLPFLSITCYLHIHPFQMLPSNSQTDIAIPSTQFCFGTICFLFHVISSVLQVYSKTGRLWADMAGSAELTEVSPLQLTKRQISANLGFPV